MKQTIQDLNQKIINLQLENGDKLEEKDRIIEELEKKLLENKKNNEYLWQRKIKI